MLEQSLVGPLDKSLGNWLDHLLGYLSVLLLECCLCI